MCKNMIPFAHAKNIFEVEISFFKSHNVSYLLLDLDNTLDSYKQALPSERVIEFIDNLRKNDITPIIISNNRGKRVKIYSEALGIEYLPNAGKPFPSKLIAYLKSKNISNDVAMMVGDQMATDIRVGNGAKLKTILVDKIVKEDQIQTRINRFFERPFRRSAAKKGKLIDWRNKYGEIKKSS